MDSSLPMKQTSANYGRVSKAAAKHLRSLVYLTRGYQSYAEADDFKKAYDDAVDVIKNSGHTLLDDYAMVHRQANEENDEIISVLTFLPEQDGIIIFRQNSICLFIVKVGLIWAFLQFIVMIMLLLCQPNIVIYYLIGRKIDVRKLLL